MARDQGVTVVITSDAQHAGDFDYLDYGVAQAQRGGLSKAAVANTRGLQQLAGVLRGAGNMMPVRREHGDAGLT